jgi:hypothetical protein
MAIFIELTTNAFEERFKQTIGESGMRTERSRTDVRRPHRGIEIKEDTYAVLKVVTPQGKQISLTDSSMPDSKGFANFMVQSVAETRMEKHQIVETFGESYVFFFGESPRFIDVKAIVLNSHDFNWEAEWWDNYEKFFRGSKLVEMGARLYLFYDDNIVEGYMVACNGAKMENAPYMASIQFRMFVTNYSNISFVGSTAFPIRASVQLPPGVELTDADARRALIFDHYQGAAYEERWKESVKYLEAGDVAVTPFGGYKKISEAFRSAGRSLAYSPDIYQMLETLSYTDRQAQQNLMLGGNRPIRSTIMANVDEYTGQWFSETYTGWFASAGVNAPATLRRSTRTVQESADLFLDSIQTLQCEGADINDPGTMDDLGLSPNFFGAKAGAAASFGPKPGGGFGFSAKASAQADFGFGVSQDPLNNIYGPSTNSLFNAGTGKNKDPRFTQGAGDPTYGYPGPFISGAGFAKAGFGDFGGTGFGSGLGTTGDPGYKDPSQFTYAGIAGSTAEEEAYNQFVDPEEGPTSMGETPSAWAVAGVGPDGSFSDAGTGPNPYASNSITTVDGKPSAFAMVSVSGTLGGPSAAEIASCTQQKTKFGFADPNPYGVKCPEPPEKDACQKKSTSTSFSASCSWEYKYPSGPKC